MRRTFQILTILGSPHDRMSNTRALVEDFVEDVARAGLPLEHRVISLGREPVLPCRGCWSCTKGKPCPVGRKEDDHLEEIKAAMIACDMLILACPVYTNQVSAQMKALFDRLFTWCHVFPLLGTYGLSACTTGNDGHGEVLEFLEKMLATYGVSSFGSIHSIGAFTPGFFPWRADARARHRKLARRVAETLLEGRQLPVNAMQRRMFKVMKRKFSGAHTIDWLRNGPVEGQPPPGRMLMRFMRRVLEKRKVSEGQLDALSRLTSFELAWWRSRGWLSARSFRRLRDRPVPAGFDKREWLLRKETHRRAA